MKLKLINILLLKAIRNEFTWPENMSEIRVDSHGRVHGWMPGLPPQYVSFFSCRASGEVVTREQYEDAISSAQKPVWDGVGLPPVGVEFEYGSHRTKAKCLGIGHHMIFASKGDPDDEEGDFEEFMISIQDSEFHPLRSEADNKRHEAVRAMISFDFDRRKEGIKELYPALYDAIAAGKIPGVKLDD